jgi:peptide/nickel transport system substrate-binding protein
LKRQRVLLNKTLAVKIIVLLIFISQIIFLSGCIRNGGVDRKEIDNEIYVGVTNDISGFYPWMIRDTASCSLNQNFFNPLIELDPKTRGIISALAESWNNPDNVTWKFFLRKGVKFHNGYNFTANDVNFTLSFLKNNFSFYNETLSSLSDIKILDNYTIEIKTYEPNPLLLYDLLSVNILSEEYINEIIDTNETWPIGTGPYKLVEYEPDKHIIFERFDEYFRGAPDIKRVNVILMDNREELRDGLIEGLLDIASIPFEYIDLIENTDNLTVKSVQYLGITYLSFDFRVNDSYGFKGTTNPLSEVNVRKAMYNAINIERLLENISNNSIRVPESQFVTQFIFGYNPDIERLPYDLEKANQLMRDAGYEDGFTIEIDCVNSTTYIDICNEIATQLSDINITVKLNPLTEFEYYSKLYLKNTSFYITGFSPLSAEGTIELLLHSSDMQENIGIWNYGNYSNPEVDRLYEIICHTFDPDIRKELIQDVFTIATEDVAWIPLYSGKAFYGVRDTINWGPRPGLYMIFEDISLYNLTSE